MNVWLVIVVTIILSFKEILFHSIVQMKIGTFKNIINVLNLTLSIILIIIIIIFVLLTIYIK